MSKPSRVAVAGCAVLATAFAAAGCSGDQPAASPTPSVTGPGSPVQPGGSPTPTTPGEPDTGQRLGPVQAVNLAEQVVRGGTVVALEADREAGTRVWDVDVLRRNRSGQTVYLAQATGAVVARRPVRLSGAQRRAPEFTAQQAIQAAVAQLPGAIREVSLGAEDGAQVWEVKVVPRGGGARELTIHAATGQVLKNEPA